MESFKSELNIKTVNFNEILILNCDTKHIQDDFEFNLDYAFNYRVSLLKNLEWYKDNKRIEFYKDSIKYEISIDGMLILFINNLNTSGNFSCFFNSELINTTIVQINKEEISSSQLTPLLESSTQTVLISKMETMQTLPVSNTFTTFWKTPTTDSSTLIELRIPKTSTDSSDLETFESSTLQIRASNSFTSFASSDQEIFTKFTTDSPTLFESTSVNKAEFETKKSYISEDNDLVLTSIEEAFTTKFFTRNSLIQSIASDKPEIETILSIQDKNYINFQEIKELEELLKEWLREYEIYKSSLKYHESFCLTNRTNLSR